MTTRELLNRAEHSRAAWIYCDPSVRLSPELIERRDSLDREIEALTAQLAATPSCPVHDRPMDPTEWGFSCRAAGCRWKHADGSTYEDRGRFVRVRLSRRQYEALPYEVAVRLHQEAHFAWMDGTGSTDFGFRVEG